MRRPLEPVLPWRFSPAHPWFALPASARLHALLLTTLTCVGFALRLHLLNAFPLREDEAIYGYWARAAMADPFFLHIWPDKPPLFIWLLAGTFSLLGASEVTARLVSIFASTLTIPLVALSALRLWHSHRAAWLAAFLLTFNPFAVSFAPTVYTDSLLVLFGVGAVVAALGGRDFWAGLLLAAACMTKQQGLFYAPLVIGLLWCARESLCHPVSMLLMLEWRHRGVSLPRAAQRDAYGMTDSPALSPRRGLSASTGAEGDFSSQTPRNDNATARGWAKLAWALLGASLVVLPVLWWDSQRWAVAPSPWALATQTYAPLAWLPPHQWLARWGEWSEFLWYLAGSWVVWLVLLCALAVALVLAWRRASLMLLVGWGIGFLLLHLVTTVQVWDRYLLPLAPWLALVASGPLALVTQRRVPDWLRRLLFLLLVVGMAEAVNPGLQAARGQLPLGGDHGDYAGLTEALAWVQKRDNPAILYHQVLGWHFRFYLYDDLQPHGEMQETPRFDLRWFPSATYLADNAAKSPYPPKYLIVPEWATPRDLTLQLAMRGLALEPRLRVGRFAVMEIKQMPRPFCDWCKSSPANATAPFMPYSLRVAPQMSTP